MWEQRLIQCGTFVHCTPTCCCGVVVVSQIALRGDDIPFDQRPSTKPKQRQKVKFSMRDFRDVSVRCVLDSEFFYLYLYT